MAREATISYAALSFKAAFSWLPPVGPRAKLHLVSAGDGRISIRWPPAKDDRAGIIIFGGV
jgi:hypothetical protein